MLEKSLEILSSLNADDSDEAVLSAAEKALSISPCCMEARIIISRILRDSISPYRFLEEGIDEIENTIKNNQANALICRSYLRGLRELVDIYIEYGRFSLALKTVNKLLGIDKEDPAGYHYKAMALYAFFERPETEKLYEYFGDGTLKTELPYMIYLYKKGNEDEVLKRFAPFINEDLLSVFNGKEEADTETARVFASCSFLINTCPYFLKEMMPRQEQVPLKEKE